MGETGWDRLRRAFRWAPLIADEHERKLQRLVDDAPAVAEELEERSPSEIREIFQAAIGRAADAAIETQELPVPEMLTLPVGVQERLRDLRFIIAATEQGEYLKTLDSVFEAAAAAGLLDETAARFTTLMETCSFAAAAVMLLEEWYDKQMGAE